MTEPDQAQIRENLRIATLANEGEIPDGAVIEYFSGLIEDWCVCTEQEKILAPYEGTYRITLPKPAPHPTLLSIVEHGCFQRVWVKWFAVDEDGRVCAFANKPYIAGHKWLWKDRSQYINLFQLPATQPNWAQQCWTIDELRDIIKQNNENAAQQDDVELSDAEVWCETLFHKGDIDKCSKYGLFHHAHAIGGRIAAQRLEAQS